MFLELHQNVAILLAFCMAYTLLFQSRDRSSLKGGIVLGLLFGFASILAMLTTTALFPGVLIDSRSIFISMAGLMGGGLSAGVAALLALVCRMILGGIGAPVGYAIIVTAALLGTGYHHMHRNARARLTKKQLYAFGLIVHMDMLLLMFALPADIRWVVIEKITLPVLLIYPIGTVLIGRLLMIQDERTATEQALRESQQRLTAILRAAPTGIGVIKNRVFVEVNPRICEITGYSSDELIGHSARMLYVSEEEFVRSGEELLGQISEKGAGAVETQWRGKDSSMIDVLFSATPLHRRDVSAGVTFAALDITERKESERELKESERRFKALHNATFGGIAIHQRGKILECNQGLSEISGYSQDELIGMDGLLLVAEESRKEVMNNIMSAYEQSYEVTGLRKNGEKYPIRLAARNIPYQGRPVRVVEFTDITERKQAEEALRESEVKYRALVESSNDLIWELDENERFSYVSPQVEAILGYTPEELIGTSPYDLMAPDEAERVRRVFQEIKQSPTVITGMVNVNLHKDGYEVVLETGGVPVLDEDGQLIGYRGVDRNITERKQAEEESARLMQAIEQVEEIIVITDAEANIQYVNPAFERVTGYGREEALGQNPRILQSGQHAPEFYQKMWETLAAGKPWSGRLINKRKDGAIYTEEATLSPVTDGSGKIVNYVAAKRDITHELELQNQFRQAQKMEAVGQMAGGIAHDFNNLLQVISGYAELFEMDLEPDDKKTPAICEIGKATQRGKTLVSQLLAFSRRQVIQPQDTNLNDVIDPLLKMMRGLIGEHIELDFIAGRELGTIHADRGMIEQVMMNLCVNARDAMPENGKLTIETKNVTINSNDTRTHTWAMPGGYVLLSVTDTGCGMARQIREKVFEPFFTTKEVGKGTGLGLSTVFGIIKQHDGHIEVHSKQGKGTTFTIYLPTVAREATAVSPRKVSGPVVGGDETILIAEDDETVLVLAEHLLIGAGYTVLTATNGEEAVAMFEQHADEIDVVMFDVVMPRLGGKQALDRILELRPGLPHLFASGYSEDEVHNNFIQKRGLHLLSKPYQTKTLLKKIREVLDEK